MEFIKINGNIYYFSNPEPGLFEINGKKFFGYFSKGVDKENKEIMIHWPLPFDIFSEDEYFFDKTDCMISYIDDFLNGKMEYQ